MKKTKINFLMIGFLAGIAYVAACGTTAQSLADTIGNAIDLAFSNITSGLTAENAQDAIDEVEGRVDALEGSTLSTLLVGTWSGTSSDEDGTTTGISLTL